jgi:ribosomal protein S20
MQEYSRRWQGEYAARLSAMYGTALRETEGKSPFAALFDDAEEDVRDAFKVATEAVAKGMGAIKQALKDPPQIIGDRQREENMEARLREVVRRVREAATSGDSMTARFYEKLRAKQQLQLDNLRGRSRVTMGEVRKDYEKAGISVEGTWADANFVMTEASRKAGAAMVEHMRSAKGDIESLDWVQTGTDMMTRLGIGVANAPPFVFAAADRIAAGERDRIKAARAAAVATPAPTASDSITVTVNGPVYGGDAGLRELERRVQRAVRQVGRERRHKQLAEG